MTKTILTVFRSDSGSLEGKKPLQSSTTIAVARSRLISSGSGALHPIQKALNGEASGSVGTLATVLSTIEHSLPW